MHWLRDVSRGSSRIHWPVDIDLRRHFLATFYGAPNADSLNLLKCYLIKYPEDAPRVVLSLKGGAYNMRRHVPDASPEGLRAAVDEAPRVLNGVKTTSMFALGRIDDAMPIETSVRALVELIGEGKIGSCGLGEVSPSTIRRADALEQRKMDAPMPSEHGLSPIRLPEFNTTYTRAPRSRRS